MSDARPVVIHVNENGNSGIGTAGLIFSCLGWLTCGILSPIGALLSMFGLLCRGSKSHAIAGLVVGFPGVIFLVFIGAGLVAGFLGIAGVTTAAVAEASRQVELRKNTPVIPQPQTPVESANVLIEPLPSKKQNAVALSSHHVSKNGCVTLTSQLSRT